MIKENEIFIVAGASGRCGSQIVKHLIEFKKTVRVLIRNQNKFEEKLKKLKIEINNIQKIVTCDLVQNLDYENKLFDLFDIQQGEIIYVYSALSYSWGEKDTSEGGNLLTNKRFIEYAATHGKDKIKKFCLLSSSHVRRPYSYISLRCNLLGGRDYMQHFKAVVEDILRKSGLKYLIIRPVGLDQKMGLSAFTLSQGDKVEGLISTETVGRLSVDLILDKNTPDNTSLECLSYPNQFNLPYEYNVGISLHSESEKDKEFIDHIKPCRIVLFSLGTTVTFFMYLSFWLQKNYNIVRNFFSYVERLIGRGNIKKLE
jgi:hypothetical protein